MANLVRLKVLAEHFEESGDYEMAEMIVRKILALSQADGKIEEILSALHNLALLLEAQGKSDEAMENARLALRLASFNADLHSYWYDELIDLLVELTAMRAA